VIIDFADYLIRGEVTESKTAELYRILAIGSKQLKCPVVLLSQLSRSYQGGIPRPYHVRYSSLTEAFAWLNIMLYNPSFDFYEERDADVLPIKDKVAYMCVWKCRGGFRLHREDSPGAIAVPFIGARGWGNKSKWFSLKKEM
jgi:hypothetical protein